MNKNLEIALDYYKGWESARRELLKISPDLKHVSPEGEFSSAKDFLDACWQYAGISMTDKQFVSDGNTVCVRYKMSAGGGPQMPLSEWLTIEDGLIKEIRVYYGSK